MDAEVVTVSHEHENHSYTQLVRDGAYEIHGPGEYEVAGVSVVGVPTYHDSEKGARHGRNTVYLIEIDDVRIRHLEPRYVVPMHYAIPGLKVDLDPVDRFLKEMGVTASEAQPKLSVQKSSVTEYETKVVVLEPKAEPRV